MDVDQEPSSIVALARRPDRDVVVEELRMEWGPETISAVRERCQARLDTHPPDTRSLLQALDLLDDALDLCRPVGP